MSEELDISGQSNQTPGPGDSGSEIISREEFQKVIAQRDKLKEELRAIRASQETSEETQRDLQSRLEKELEDRTISEQRRQELTAQLESLDSQYNSEKEQLETKLQEIQGQLDETQKEVSDHRLERMLTDEEKAFLDAAQRASFTDKNAEILLGYLRGRRRLRSTPIYVDESKQKVSGYRHEVECIAPKDEGIGFETKLLPLDEAMPYLKQEKKTLAPSLASGGGRGSLGSDGEIRPGVLKRQTMTVEQYKASKHPVTGRVMVQ